jgi:hypothetical protein
VPTAPADHFRLPLLQRAMIGASPRGVETLINCAEDRDLLFHARVAVLRALNRGCHDDGRSVRRQGDQSRQSRGDRQNDWRTS